MATDNTSIGVLFAGSGLMATGGFLEALAAIGSTAVPGMTFGVLPTGLIGLGAVVVGVGLYQRFVRNE